MDLAMTLPTMLPHGRDEVLAWCRGIDEGPWSSLAVPERITFPSHSMVVQLAAAAALTERVRLWTTIVVLPSHHAVEVAKQMASVDRLCDGRLTVGVGVGGREHDYLAIGAAFTKRWSRMDDQVATMRRIWAGEPPFPGADPVGPPPVQPGGPPLIAGALGPKAIGRAARWADGVDGAWTLDGDEAAVRAAFDLIEAAWRAAGRDDEPHLSTSIWYALGDDAETRLRTYAYDYLKIFGEAAGQYGAQSVACFTPDALRRAVDNIATAGADELFLVPTTTDPDELARTRDALGI
jgi:alkanesulfonate monooxygenase SsuD/methylene tetrahydromethanopterin reductase-like flavin-dependent oxidoreductase (luciferase family)